MAHLVQRQLEKENDLFRRLWSHRGLVLALVRRQYQIRYRQSMVGITWAILPPLATLAAGMLVFKGIAGVDTGDEEYSVVTMAALVPWTFFATSLTAGIPSIVSNSTTLTRIPFPRAALPVGTIGISIIDFVISGAIFVFIAYAVGDGLPLTALWFPALFAVELVLILGVVLVGSAMNVFARDIKLAVPLGTQLWLLLTPVLYPLSGVPESMRAFVLANPMTGLVESFRDVLVHGTVPDPGLLWPTMVGAMALLAIGSWYFSSVETRFADVV
ncbi:MAG: ABC transporter permease [Actinomycetota bacterium]